MNINVFFFHNVFSPKLKRLTIKQHIFKFITCYLFQVDMWDLFIEIYTKNSNLVFLPHSDFLFSFSFLSFPFLIQKRYQFNQGLIWFKFELVSITWCKGWWVIHNKLFIVKFSNIIYESNNSILKLMNTNYQNESMAFYP